MRNTQTIYDDKFHLGLLIHLANQYKDQIINEYFAGSNITAQQFNILINIYKGHSSSAEISKNLMMDAGGLSRMVDRMLKRELITRIRNTQDKRQVLLSLTDKGQILCERFEKDAQMSITGNLTTRLTPEESRLLIKLLTKMLPDDITTPHH